MGDVKVLDSSSLPCESVNLHLPDLKELAKVLENGLLNDFLQSKVQVLEKCPNLLEPPYCLSAKGFGSKDAPTCVIDIGGPPYLLPLPDRSKFYSLADLAKKKLGYEGSSAFLVGAGAGPWPRIGPNCEVNKTF